MFDKIANEDYERAVMKGLWRKITNWFSGENNELMSYDDVRKRIPFRGQHYRGLQQVDVKQVIGSVDRYRDFDRTFVPVQRHTRSRWVNIDKAHYEDVILPPVELIKIGELYFVQDGNHRISVARERGQKYIDAYVTEIAVPGPVKSESDIDLLIVAEERNEFNNKTKLDEFRPDNKLETKRTGQYTQLLQQIDAHRWYMSERRNSEVPYGEAVISWYDTIYAPVIELFRENHLTNVFPEASELDLYLWLMVSYAHFQQAINPNAEQNDPSLFDQLLANIPDIPVRRFLETALKTNLLTQITTRLEYARFMEQTRLAELRPGSKMDTKIPGTYDTLLEHIKTHQWFMGEWFGREVSSEEALLSWYDTVYMPIVQIIREQEILKVFPKYTETDLYVWIIERQWTMRESEGDELSYEEAAEQIAEDHTPVIQRMYRNLLQGKRKSRTRGEKPTDHENDQGDGSTTV